MAFLQEARQFIPQERIYTDELRRLAWGTDAGFYRLIPQIVIRSEGEEEISRLLKLAGSHNLPVTFRAAGTSPGRWRSLLPKRTTFPASPRSNWFWSIPPKHRTASLR